MTRINQSVFTVRNYSIQDLLNMKTCLGVEQSPINIKTVEKIQDSFVDGTALLQPLEVSIYEDTEFLSGGRHRTQALALEYEDDLSREVSCLVYAVDTAKELVQRLVASNDSRRMVKAEVSELNTAAKFGFSTLDVYECVSKAITTTDDMNALELVTRALAIQLTDVLLGQTPNTILKTAATIISKFNKTVIIKRTVTTPEQLDTDGTVLVPAKKITTRTESNVLRDKLTKARDAIALIDMSDESVNECLETEHLVSRTELSGLVLDEHVTDIIEWIESIGTTILNMAVDPVEITSKMYALGHTLGCVDATEPTLRGDVMYSTCIRIPSALQRNVAKWVTLFMHSYTTLNG